MRRNPPLEWHFEHDDLDEIVQGLVAQHGQRRVLDAVFAVRSNPDISPAQRARREQHLDKPIRFRGGVVTIREFLQQLAEEGGQLVTDEVPRIKDMSRRAAFRASEREQQEHARRQREAGMKTVYAVRLPDDSEFEIKKIEAEAFEEFASAFGEARFADEIEAEEAEITAQYGERGTPAREQYERDMDHLFGRGR